MFWLIFILLLSGAVAAWVVYVLTQKPSRTRMIDRARRATLVETSERIPLAPPHSLKSESKVLRENNGPDGPLVEPEAREASELRRRLEVPDEADASAVGTGAAPMGRLVNTPEGEAIITTPPFVLRGSLLSRRMTVYARQLAAHAPAWVAVCPKVRLEALVTPTSPDGRDPADWRTWRKRVRLRAVDFVLCDRRDFRPLVAIVIELEGRPRLLRSIAGGRDRMIDEVLHAAGLPLVRGNGKFREDWPAIRPYVEEAILKSGLADEELDRQFNELSGLRAHPDAAVGLLQLDDTGFALDNGPSNE